MADPLFLSESQIRRMHRTLIERYGGSDGVRDAGLLSSALEQPRAMFGGQFLHEDVFEMAAAYLFHLVQNHPFIDGNKRAGAAAAVVFLDLNGVELEADEDGLYDLTIAVATGRAEKPEIAAFLRARAADRC